jgi:MFS family permease
MTASTKTRLLLFALSFLLYIDRVNLSTAAGPLQKELGLSNTELGVAFSAFAYSYLVFQIIGGVIADTYGSRRTLIGCVSIWVVTTIATGLVGGLASLFLVRLFLGCGEGATLPSQARAITNWTPVAQRGMMQGVTHSFSRLGNAVTPPLVAMLIVFSSWRWSFVILGCLTAIWLVFWMISFRDTPRQHALITEAELERLPERGASFAAKPPPIPWIPLLKRVAPISAVYFCYGWTGYMYFTWLPSFFMHGYNMNIRSSALYASGVFFAGVVGDACGGLISDRLLKATGNLNLARSAFISFSFVASLFCLVPVLVVKDVDWITIALSGAFFFIELTIAPTWAVPMDIAPQYSGTASGVMNAGSAVAGVVSPIVFGIIIDATGTWTAPFIGSIALLLVGALLTITIRPHLRMVALPDGKVELVRTHRAALDPVSS